MYVLPAPGLKIRDPSTRLLLPEAGGLVDAADIFWARALRDGDVLAGDPPPAEVPEALTLEPEPQPPAAEPDPPAEPAPAPAVAKKKDAGQ